MNSLGKTITRTALYDAAWTQPISKLDKEFGVSDVGLAKACRKLSVPLPPRGYWARKAAGKPVIQVPLPPRPPGLADETTVGSGGDQWRWQWPPDDVFLGTFRRRPGHDTMAGGSGSDLMIAGTGGDEFDDGGGADVLQFFSGSAGASDDIYGFKVGTDTVSLVGYSSTAQSSALSGQTTDSSGGTILTLEDGSVLDFHNIASVDQSVFA